MKSGFEKISDEIKAYFRSTKAQVPSVKTKVSDAVIETVFWPGFSISQSHWRLIIDKNGNLFQDTSVCEWTPETGIVKGRRQEHLHIGVDALASLLLKAEEVGFLSYQDSYDADHVTDLEFSTIRICGAKEKKVKTYGAGWLAYHGDSDMKGYMELWKVIHAYAPFPPKLT